MNFKQLKCVPKFAEEHIAFMKSIGFTPFKERDGTVFAFTKNLSKFTYITIRNDELLNITLSFECDGDEDETVDLSEVFGIIQTLLENGIILYADSCTD